MGMGSLHSLKLLGRGARHPSQFSAKVTVRVGYSSTSPSGLSWQVTGWTLICSFFITAGPDIAFGLDAIVTNMKPDISRLKFTYLTAGLQIVVATAFCKVVLIFVGHFFGTRFMSPFWHPEFLEEDLSTPMYSYCFECGKQTRRDQSVRKYGNRLMLTIPLGKTRSEMQSCLVLSGAWQVLRHFLPRRRATE